MRVLSFVLAFALCGVAADSRILYGETGSGVSLDMVVHPAAGPGPHPAALVIRTGLGLDLDAVLPSLGITTFSAALAPPPADWREATGHLRRAIRYLRHHAPRWGVDPNRIVLIGGSAGGYIANLAAVMSGDPDRTSRDPIERESAAVQAVIVFGAPADLRGQELPPGLRPLLARDIERWGEKLASSGASPVMHIRTPAPPFLLLHGDRDEFVPLEQSAHWQLALQNRGIRADLIIIENGGAMPSEWDKLPRVRDWRREMLEWLAAVFARRP